MTNQRIPRTLRVPDPSGAGIRTYSMGPHGSGMAYFTPNLVTVTEDLSRSDGGTVTFRQAYYLGQEARAMASCLILSVAINIGLAIALFCSYQKSSTIGSAATQGTSVSAPVLSLPPQTDESNNQNTQDARGKTLSSTPINCIYAALPERMRQL